MSIRDRIVSTLQKASEAKDVTLDLSFHGIGEGGASILLELEYAHGFEDVSLYGNKITAKDLRTLLASDFFNGLKALNLG
ncbi:MAG: hypothetical protein AAGJ35_11120, partial [Myxococcota bacterium]